jgi:hypothetical protein
MDWQAWKTLSEKDQNQEIQGDRRRANYFQFQVLPRQIHYFADFVCNGVFWSHQSRMFGTAPFSKWFNRGFVLNAIDPNVDAWLKALRSFANGDKAPAILDLHSARALTLAQGNAAILKQRTKQWPHQLTGAEYRTIFQRITSAGEQKANPQGATRLR